MLAASMYISVAIDPPSVKSVGPALPGGGWLLRSVAPRRDAMAALYQDGGFGPSAVLPAEDGLEFAEKLLTRTSPAWTRRSGTSACWALRVPLAASVVDAVGAASFSWAQTWGMDDEVQPLLAEQVAYYRAHAPDYDDNYLGKDWGHSIEELPITATSWSWPAAPAIGLGC